jgi:hypothetical protein
MGANAPPSRFRAVSNKVSRNQSLLLLFKAQTLSKQLQLFCL